MPPPARVEGKNTVLVLLPPSEGKAAPQDGPPLALDALSLPELTVARETVLDALVGLCAGEGEAAEAAAREVLGLGERLRGEVARNAALRSAPTGPAGEIYTGVLYDALSLPTLPTAARRRAEETLLVFSGLWGAVRPSDHIPAYRCSAGVKLPGLGALGTWWREPLGRELPTVAADATVVLDLRSAAYARMWQPSGELAERTVTVRVLLSTVVDGVAKRSVVSHHNKATKGRLVRDLLTEGATPAGPKELVETLRELGHTVEEPERVRPGRPRQLDVVVTEV